MQRDNDAPLLLDVTRLVWRRWTGTRATGIDRICMAWLEHYAERAQAVVIHRTGEAILPRSTSRALFKLLVSSQDRRRDTVRFHAALAALTITRSGHLRDRLDGYGRFWLNPGHTGLDSQRVAEWVRRRKLRLIPLVHDLIPITHPQYCRSGEDERHRHRMRTVLDLASGVIANSAHTLQALRSFATSEERPLPPSVVAWPGTPMLPSLPPQEEVKPTFVVLGTIEGRKNHGFLLSVWRRLMQLMRPDLVPQLVIVGRRGWQANDVFARLDSGEFGETVRELGPLDDRHLAGVLGSARALLFPSQAEGYGIPLAEALAAGVPVIASDLPVFREIGQGVPELLPLNNPEIWASAIAEYAQKPSGRRAEQLFRLRSFEAPNWREHFSRIDQFLDSLDRHEQLAVNDTR